MYALLDADGRQLGGDWLPANSVAALSGLRRVLDGLRRSGVAIGIDAPRAPLPSPRPWTWNRTHGWQPCPPSAKGRGRHCEIVIKASGLANPQWTPLEQDAPEWMRFGFDLFRGLSDFEHLYEVFPSASYTQLHHERRQHVTISFAGVAPGPKDMLDAIVSAFTVREFVAGRGASVGGRDELGQIILPRPLVFTGDSRVHEWPMPLRAAT